MSVQDLLDPPPMVAAARLKGADPADAVVGWLRPSGPGVIAAQTAGWGAVEWARAREATLVHGIAPLLADRLGPSAGWLALAPLLRDYLAEQRAANARRAELMLADLAALLRSSAALGVALLPLKGAVLAAHYYPAPALRPMADLDLLVRPEQLPATHAALASIGLQLSEITPRHRVYQHPHARVVRYDGEHPNNPRGVEVHTVVDERQRLIAYDLTATLWAGALPASYAGAPGLRPTPVALLQHLLIHTSHNILARRLRLIQLYDLALVAPQVAPEEWMRAVTAAARAGEARLLYAPLALAERLFGPLAPAAARQILARATPPALRRLIARSTPNDLSLCNRDEVSPAFKLAWYRPGAEWLRALWHVLVPTRYDLIDHYPQLAGRPGHAYLRHLGHVSGWALRLAQRSSRVSSQPPM